MSMKHFKFFGAILFGVLISQIAGCQSGRAQGVSANPPVPKLPATETSPPATQTATWVPPGPDPEEQRWRREVLSLQYPYLRDEGPAHRGTKFRLLLTAIRSGYEVTRFQ